MNKKKIKRTSQRIKEEAQSEKVWTNNQLNSREPAMKKEWDRLMLEMDVPEKRVCAWAWMGMHAWKFVCHSIRAIKYKPRIEIILYWYYYHTFCQ